MCCSKELFEKIRSHIEQRRRRQELEEIQRARDLEQFYKVLSKSEENALESFLLDPHAEWPQKLKKLSSAGDDGHITDDMIIDYMSSKNILK